MKPVYPVVIALAATAFSPSSSAASARVAGNVDVARSVMPLVQVQQDIPADIRELAELSLRADRRGEDRIAREVARALRNMGYVIREPEDDSQFRNRSAARSPSAAVRNNGSVDQNIPDSIRELAEIALRAERRGDEETARVLFATLRNLGYVVNRTTIEDESQRRNRTVARNQFAPTNDFGRTDGPVENEGDEGDDGDDDGGDDNGGDDDGGDDNGGDDNGGDDKGGDRGRDRGDDGDSDSDGDGDGDGDD